VTHVVTAQKDSSVAFVELLCSLVLHACIRHFIFSIKTGDSAMAEGTRDALVSRNSATTKYHYCMALFA